jgi:hypothetical protein
MVNPADSAPSENPVDPYDGTPLGVEVPWWPNGIEIPDGTATPEASIRPLRKGAVGAAPALFLLTRLY